MRGEGWRFNTFHILVFSVDQLLDYVDVHAFGSVWLLPKLDQIGEQLRVGFPKDAPNFVNPERTARRVIRTILNINDEKLVASDALLGRELEKASAIEAILLRIEILAVKFEEFLQVLRQGTKLVDSKSFQVGRSHQHDRV